MSLYDANRLFVVLILVQQIGKHLIGGLGEQQIALLFDDALAFCPTIGVNEGQNGLCHGFNGW